jgi:hypothetical protein
MLRTVLLALVALAVLAATATAAPAVENRCGDVVVKGLFDTPQDVRALGVSCRRAKRLARHHYRSSGRNETCDLAKPSCRLDGWTCRRTFFGNSGTRVRCTSGERRVRWFYGA